MEYIYSDDQKCLEHLEQVRWNGIVTSPFVPDSQVYICKNGRYKCRESGKYFTARTNTIFHSTRVSLSKWFYAIQILQDADQKITSVGLAKQLQTTQKTAWFILQKLRKAGVTDSGSKLPLLQPTSAQDQAQSTKKLTLTAWLNLYRQ
jgi:hypothetical protein